MTSECLAGWGGVDRGTSGLLVLEVRTLALLWLQHAPAPGLAGTRWGLLPVGPPPRNPRKESVCVCMGELYLCKGVCADVSVSVGAGCEGVRIEQCLCACGTE